MTRRKVFSCLHCEIRPASDVARKCSLTRGQMQISFPQTDAGQQSDWKTPRKYWGREREIQFVVTGVHNVHDALIASSSRHNDLHRLLALSQKSSTTKPFIVVFPISPQSITGPALDCVHAVSVAAICLLPLIISMELMRSVLFD